MAVSINYVHNKNVSAAPGPDWLTIAAGAEVRRLHESMAAFAPTELKSLKNLKRNLIGQESLELAILNLLKRLLTNTEIGGTGWHCMKILHSDHLV